MTPQELEEVKQFVLRELPRVLEQDPQFVVFIEGIVSEKFPRRDEFARLLDELAASRWENREQFHQVNERLDGMDERFDKVDEGFGKMDERFDGVDEGFGKMDERFDRVDGRLDKLEPQVVKLRREMMSNTQTLKGIDRRLQGFDAWMNLYTGMAGSDKGQRLEDTFAAALRFGLRNPDLSPDDIRLRVKLTDREGMIYKPGTTTEVDIVVHDRRWTVFEIKASAEIDDVDILEFKLKLLRAQNPDQEIRGVFFSSTQEKELKQRCQLYQIELVEPLSTLSEPWAKEWIAREDEEILRAEHPELFDTDLPDSDQ
jgi:hypothetical protein